MAIQNEFLQTYLNMVEDTESPRIFHTWAALSGISACLGRRACLPFGFSNIWCNQYVILVGPPAVKKSTAINIAAGLLKEATGVKFAPDDTAGQRQGLLSAMQSDKDEDEVAFKEAFNEVGVENLGSLGGVADTVGQLDFDTRDPYSMYVSQSELQTILGQNNQEILTFLIKMWDGENYQYRLKNTNITIKDAVVNLLAGTTPSSLAACFPVQAIGHGFTSRVLFVYAGEKYKIVPRPKPFDPKLQAEIKRVYSEVYHNLQGEFRETKGAEELYDHLYRREVQIKDSRFTHYSERRPTHLLKLSMVLAASRMSLEITENDVEIANELLLMTEETMPDALGEYGLSKLSVAKQKLLEYVRSSPEAIPIAALKSIMSNDMTERDFVHTVNELKDSGKISKVQIPQLGWCVIGKAREKSKRKNEIFDLLKEG